MDKKKREALKMTRVDVVKSKIRYRYYRNIEKIFFWRKYGPWEHWVWVYEKGQCALYKDGKQCDEKSSFTTEYFIRERLDNKE